MKSISPGGQPPSRRVVATLTFDSRSSGSAFGMRSIRKASRQMLYSAQDADLDLRISVQNEECILAGQVIREGCAGALVEISGATASARARLSELCEFTLPAIPVGIYSLTIRMSGCGNRDTGDRAQGLSLIQCSMRNLRHFSLIPAMPERETLLWENSTLARCRTRLLFERHLSRRLEHSSCTSPWRRGLTPIACGDSPHC